MAAGGQASVVSWWGSLDVERVDIGVELLNAGEVLSEHRSRLIARKARVSLAMPRNALERRRVDSRARRDKLDQRQIVGRRLHAIQSSCSTEQHHDGAEARFQK